MKAFHAVSRRFPKGLEDQPLLLPPVGTAVRGELDTWFLKLGWLPRIVGEFDDSALVKVFGARGRGIFAAPTVVEAEVLAHHHVEVLGRVEEVRHAFYAISVERRLRHPAVLALAERARRDLFG